MELLLQVQFEVSVSLLWITFLILLVLTFILLGGSVYMRGVRKSIEHRVAYYEGKFYPIVLDYLESGKHEDEVLKHFRGARIEYAVFEKVVIELIGQLQGSDASKIRQLLYIDPIFEYHMKQLDSNSDVEQVKACNYFAYVRLVNFTVIERLRSFLDDENRLLAFSAASALMASKNVVERANALEIIAKRKRISEMALLELLYKFKYIHDDQREQEAKKIKEIVQKEGIPDDNLALLIVGSSEIGYFQLREFFFALLLSKKEKWNTVAIKIALIRAQGYFLNFDASPHLRKMLEHPDIKVVRATALVLSMLKGDENEEALFRQITGKDQEKDFYITSALFQEGYEIPYIIDNAATEQKEELKALLDIIRHEPEMN